MATHIKPTSYQLSEADMKTLIRNALLVAGHEMGEEGDHWPVVKNTITDIMRDWEALDIERAVQAEIKTHLYAHLDGMEELLKTCPPEMQAQVAPHLAELREVYDAAFQAPEEIVIDLEEEVHDENLPLYCKRAEAILDVLFDDNAMEESYA